MPLVQGRLMTMTPGEYDMCALPARSIPGSEMLLVENTRMRGTPVPSVVVGFSGASVVIARCLSLPVDVAAGPYLPRTTKVRS